MDETKSSSDTKLQQLYDHDLLCVYAFISPGAFTVLGWACVGKPNFQSKSGKIGWVPTSFLQPVSKLDESCIDHSVEYARFVQGIVGMRCVWLCSV